MIHISQLSAHRVDSVEDILAVKEKVIVKVVGLGVRSCVAKCRAM